MRYLGIDYGSRKTGLALSDEAGKMGFPHSVKSTDPRLLDDLTLLIKEKEVGAVVMGESKGFDGNDNKIAKEARAFGKDLAAHAGIPVHFESEMFTTQAARRMPDGSRMEGSPDVDASAAALILTSYLERIEDEAKRGDAQTAAMKTQPAPASDVPAHISIDDFAKVTVKVGTVLSAERVPETDKLLRLMVDLGENEPRQIVSGIAAYTEPEALVGRQLCFVANLASRKIKGLESNGMLFAVGEGETFAFVTPDRPVPPGTSAH